MLKSSVFSGGGQTFLIASQILKKYSLMGSKQNSQKISMIVPFKPVKANFLCFSYKLISINFRVSLEIRGRHVPVILDREL
jgi:hypothetical protein